MATFGTFADGQVLSAAELNGAGAFTNYTPTWTQSATITKTVYYASYTQLNKWVFVNFQMTATSAGTANNLILVGLPVAAAASNTIMGTGVLIDVSVGVSGTLYPLLGWYVSSTTAGFYLTSANETDYATSGFGLTASAAAVTIASGDIIAANFVYRAS